MIYVTSFIVGGLVCVIAQILLDVFNLEPGKVIVSYICFGAFLVLVGWFMPIKNFAPAGITVPIIGFGASLAQGAIEAAKKGDLLGILSGGLIATAAGISFAIVIGYLFGLIAKPKEK